METIDFKDTEKMVSLTSGSTKTVYDKITGFNVEDQVKLLSSVDEPQRTELLLLIVKENLSTNNKDFVSNVQLRFDILSSIHPENFTKFEIEYYKNLLLLTFKDVLFIEDFIDFIEWVLYDQHLLVERLKYDRENTASVFDKEELTNDISLYGRFEIYLRALLNHLIQNSQNTYPKAVHLSQDTIFISPSQLDPLFEILKDYFQKKDQQILLETITNGNVVPTKLIFKGRANQLCDIIRKLYDENFIPGYDKKDVERWLVLNFQSLKSGKPSDLNPTTTERSISGDEYVCKSPIIEIQGGVITRASRKQRN